MDFTPSFFFSSSFYRTCLPNTTMSTGRPKICNGTDSFICAMCYRNPAHLRRQRIPESLFRISFCISQSSSSRLCKSGYPPHRCFQIHWRVLRTDSGCCCIGEEGWIPAPHPTNQDLRSTRPSPSFSYRHRYSEYPIPSAFHESSPALPGSPDIDPVFPNTHSATSSSRCVIGGMRPARSRSSARTDGFSVVLSQSGSSFPRSSIFNSASSSASLALFSVSSASWGNGFPSSACAASCWLLRLSNCCSAFPALQESRQEHCPDAGYCPQHWCR